MAVENKKNSRDLELKNIVLGQKLIGWHQVNFLTA
jgi:hypothetical protein